MQIYLLFIELPMDFRLSFFGNIFKTELVKSSIFVNIDATETLILPSGSGNAISLIQFIKSKKYVF